MSGRAAVLILTGPPGSGKTTVARAITERREQAVHVESDVFFHFIRAGFVEPWRPESHGQNTVVMNAVAEAAVSYARGGYFTVIDGIVSPRWFLEPLKTAIASRGLRPGYAILRPKLDTAIARARARGPQELSDASVVAQLYGDFTGIGDLERHVIDNGELTVDETAEAIERRLANGELYV